VPRKYIIKIKVLPPKNIFCLPQTLKPWGRACTRTVFDQFSSIYPLNQTLPRFYKHEVFVDWQLQNGARAYQTGENVEKNLPRINLS